MDELEELTKLRHPDPSLTHKLEIQFPELQVLGSWKKLTLLKKGGMKARLAFSSFIWNSKLYVGGGAYETKGPWLRDLWCLDLEKLDKWRQLPSYPVSEQYTGVWLLWRFSIHNNRAYLVTGKAEVDYFDLITEEWGSVMTTYKRTAADKKAGVHEQWVFPVWNILDSTQEVVGDILYLFGGTHGECIIGTNLFVQLDLKTMEWTRLSGTLRPGEIADYSCPGPRKTPSSWVDRDQERIYLIFGECDRSAGIAKGDRHAAEHGYAYEDFWSWDIKAKEWRMERLVGNVPCPRSEAACTYNPKMDKTVIFGGYNPTLPTQFGNNFFPFSYYADTFMYFPPPPPSTRSIFPPSSGKWKHVLTPGFPTYRAQSQLHTDPATGKMYLFGGYVNTDSVPSRKTYNSRTFGDLWQLRVDAPGGFFDEKDVDLEEERKTAMVGPWQRCFTCGSTGRWKKCGGSCKGQAFFCDSECLREGWKEHKVMHGCKNLKI